MLLDIEMNLSFTILIRVVPLCIFIDWYIHCDYVFLSIRPLYLILNAFDGWICFPVRVSQTTKAYFFCYSRCRFNIRFILMAICSGKTHIPISLRKNIPVGKHTALWISIWFAPYSSIPFNLLFLHCCLFITNKMAMTQLRCYVKILKCGHWQRFGWWEKNLNHALGRKAMSEIPNDCIIWDIFFTVAISTFPDSQ